MKLGFIESMDSIARSGVGRTAFERQAVDQMEDFDERSKLTMAQETRGLPFRVKNRISICFCCHGDGPAV